MQKLISLAAGMLLAAAAWGAQAADWDMPTPYGEKNFHTVNISKFAADVKAATGGALNIKVHSGGSLFKHPEIKNAVRGGQVPIGEFLLSRLSNESAVFGVDSVPFLAADYGSAAKLWSASRSAVEKLLAKQGLKVLFAVPWPPQGLYAKREINSVADLKNLKFRAYNAATERLAQLAGAVPTQIELANIAEAFATGGIHAVVTSSSTGVNHKFWDFLTHYYRTQAWLPKNIVVVNMKAFGRLDAKTKKAVMAAAKTAEARGWKSSQAETSKMVAALKKNGIKVMDPSAKLKSDLQAIGKTMTMEWSKKAGAEGAAIIKAYRK